jgi:phenylacetate-CoA ligase
MHRWLAWNVLFRLQERAKGHPTFRILRDMEAADRLGTAELEQFQAVRLRQFLDYCYSHVPYVRDRMRESGISPSQILGPRDLQRLPIMRKADVRQHREELRSDIAGRLSSYTTGGSTGEPLIFDLAKSRVASRVACRQRVSRWWGVSVGDKEIALWGAPVELTKQDWIRSMRDRLFATRLLFAFEMNEATISRYLDVLEERGCRQIFGYPSAIHLLCLQARQEGRDLRRLGIRVVFVTGEVLFPHQRDLISQTLACPVADGYGGRDSGFIAHECPQGGMHVMADAVVTEIVDASGRPVAPGETGEIVVTDLYSCEAPFLRYATGDIAAFSARRCPCGRALPLLERIEGRSNDSVVAPDGRIINSLALIYPVREVEGIEQFRIIQRKVDCFHVQLVCNQTFPKDGEGRIRAGWTRLLRSTLDVTFEYMPTIPAERLGKFRHIVSELPAGHNAPEGKAHLSLAESTNG